MRALPRHFVLLVLALLVTGCGQKGPLYRPAPEPAPVVTPEQDQADGDTEDEGADTR